MDRIFIEGLRIEAIIGVHPHERVHPQTLMLDLSLDTDISRAAATDNLEAALDYAAVAAQLTAWTQAGQFQLLEALAVHLADRLHAEWGVRGVDLRIRKPAALADTDAAGVHIRRSWSH